MGLFNFPFLSASFIGFFLRRCDSSWVLLKWGPGRDLIETWKGLGRDLEGTWKGLGGDLEGTWKGLGGDLVETWWRLGPRKLVESRFSLFSGPQLGVGLVVNLVPTGHNVGLTLVFQSLRVVEKYDGRQDQASSNYV